jgi:3-phenylpropionate/trans-cinnamate dioxygenase ferredoxin subunit
MSRHVIAPANAISPGARMIVNVAGRSIGIFNVDGRFLALRNQCPHQGGPLCAGTVIGRLDANLPGDYVYDSGNKRLKCPWHGWEFDMVTGQSWFDPMRQRVRSYRISVETGEVLLHGQPGLQPGPYVAETIAVTVDRDYLVVEIPT